MNPIVESAPVQSEWFLSERAERGAAAKEVPVNANPFRIGRLPNLSLSLEKGSVSKLHAEIVMQGGSLWVKDLRSTNGTYVNGRPIRDMTPLHANDLLQIAEVTFRVGHRPAEKREKAAPAGGPGSARAVCFTPPRAKSQAGGAAFRYSPRESQANERTLPSGAAVWAQKLVQFDSLMHARGLAPHFQPIVRLADRETVGYEVLARSHLDGLDQPRLMFSMAEKVDQQCALSDLLRVEGIRAGAAIPGRPNLFLNTLPAEIITRELVDSLVRLRRQFPEQPLTVEIHHAAVADMRLLAEFRAVLRDLRIGLAFDDFGAGQTRLAELLEVSPDFVTFDMPLIRDIHQAAPERQQEVAAMVRLARDRGVATLAEGIEQAETLQTCRQLGFDLAIGMHIGGPAPVSAYAPPGKCEPGM